MRCDQNRELPLLLDVGEHLPNGHARNGVQPGRRLIEKENLGAVHQAARDLKPPPHSSRQGLCLCPSPLCEVHQFEEFINRLLTLRRGHVVKLSVDAQIFFDSQINVAGQRLRNHANGPPRIVGIAAYVKAGNLCATRGDRNESCHHANQRGLAGAVRSQQSEDFSFFHKERNIVHSGEVAKFLDDVLHLDRIARAVG